MKKIIKKFWGVAFVVVLLSTLFVGAVPQASAGNLSFTVATLPSDVIGGITALGTTISNFVVAGDQTTIYALTNAGALKSINAGRSWAPLAYGLSHVPGFVAVAPDNPNLVAFVDNTGASAGNVSISVDGGVTFHGLGRAHNVAGTVTGNVSAVAIAKAAVVEGNLVNLLAVVGTNLAGTGAALFYYNVGAFYGTWKDAVVDNPIAGQNLGAGKVAFRAITFSPTFSYDFLAYLVAETAARPVLVEVSFNSNLFNGTATGIPGFQVGYTTTTQYIGAVASSNITTANIIFDPNYSFAEPTSRTLYISLTYGSSSLNGSVFKVTDTDIAATNPTIAAMAIPAPVTGLALSADGTTLIAAAAGSNQVWRVNTAIGVPAVSRVIKRVGVTSATDYQRVAYAGSALLLSKGGTSGAFAMSTDNGFTFNDISLVNTELLNINDHVVSADGTQRYVIADNGATATSVFFFNGTYWERTLTLANVDKFVAGASPNNFDILYMGDKTNANVYYTTTHGTVNWQLRNSPITGSTMADLAVQDDSSLFVATNKATSGYVTKLTVTGLIWPSAPPYYNAPFGVHNIASLTLVGTDKVIAGGVDGVSAYTRDGGATAASWLPLPVLTGNSVFAVASDLTAGSTIYAVADNATSGAVNTGVYYYIIGTSVVWSANIFNGATTGARCASISSGLLINDGAIYRLGYASEPAISDVMLSRSFLPGFAPEWASTNISAQAVGGNIAGLPTTAVANVRPNVLKASAGDKLWFIDNRVAPTTDRIITYTDSMLNVVPTIAAPSNPYLIQVNKETGNAYNVTLAWNAATGATWYSVQIAYDSAFTRVFSTDAVFGPGPITNFVIGPNLGAVRAINYQPGETYYWRVRGTTPFFTRWSSVYTLMVQPAPVPVPELMSPLNGESVNNLTPGFSWSAMSGQSTSSGITDTYTFQLATDSSFSNPVLVYVATTTVAGLSLPADVVLVDGTQYFWRVKTGTSVTGDWSTVANFTVNIPTAPVTVTQTSFTVTAPVNTLVDAENNVGPAYIWAIIIIGAVLVIAVIVLIFRTRQSS